MKKGSYTLIVITYTIFNIGILIGYNKYVENSTIAYDRVVYTEEDGKIAGDLNTKDNQEGESTYKEGLKDSVNNEKQKNEEGKIAEKKGNSSLKAYMDEGDRYTYESDKNLTLNNNSSKTNLDNKVFIVDAYDIEEKLSIVEKVKLVTLLKDLTYEDFEQIEKYMNYKNEKLAVVKTLNLLEEKLDEKEIEQIKVIFSKYIDLKKVEGQY